MNVRIMILVSFIVGILIGIVSTFIIYGDYNKDVSSKEITIQYIKEPVKSCNKPEQIKRGKFHLLQEVPYFESQEIKSYRHHQLNNAYPLDDNGYFKSKQI